MVGFAVQITGLDAVAKKLDALVDKGKVQKAVLQGALMIESDAKLAIAHGSKTGQIYRRGSISHQASAPGEAPATDTGRLISSIQHWVDSDGLNIAIGTKLDYGSYLEFGTRNMVERPYIHPALEKNRTAILELITKALQGS